MPNERKPEKVDRPQRKGNKGRVIADLRAEGRELVDEERLFQLFTDLDRIGYIDKDSSVSQMSKEAMRILRG